MKSIYDLKNFDELKKEFDERRERGQTKKQLETWLNHIVQEINNDPEYDGDPVTGLFLYRVFGGFTYD